MRRRLGLGPMEEEAQRIRTLLGPHCARVFNSAPLSIPDAAETLLTFDSERWDVDGMHDAVNPSRITFLVPGPYMVGAQDGFAVNAVGYRRIRMRLNGATIIAVDSRPAAPTIGTNIALVTNYVFAAGDYVEVLATQDSGGPLNIVASAANSPEFWAVRIG